MSIGVLLVVAALIVAIASFIWTGVPLLTIAVILLAIGVLVGGTTALR